MLIFNYPYTDLYSLNLDWIIKAIKEVQQVIGELGTVVNSVNGQSGDVVLTNEMITSILGSVVNSVNGQAGAVVITKEMLTTILEGVVNSFNGRTGTVQLLPADVNATRIDITWTSDPGDTIGSLTQAEIDALYADGKRILIFVNNVGSPDQIYFLTIVGDVVTPQPYTPTAATSGVLSVNGQSGVVTLNADNLPVALGETDTIGDALDSKQAALTFDNAPTANSANPVTSGGVYTADQSLGNAITTLAGTVNQHSDQIANVEISNEYSSILDAVNAYKSIKAFPFTIQKNGNSVFTDLPTEMSNTDEWNLLCYGSQSRTTLILSRYTQADATYIRTMFNGSYMMSKWLGFADDDQIVALGNKVSNNNDAYSSSRAYAIGDLVIYDNALYRCTTACSAASWDVNQSCFTANTLTNAINVVNGNVAPFVISQNFLRGVDLNNVRATGIYWLNGNITNGLNNANYGILVVIASTIDEVRQIHFFTDSSNCGTRQMHSGNWNAWQRFNFTT